MRQFSTGTRRPARKVVQMTALAAVLAATGAGVARAAPAATVNAPGDVTFTAAGLALVLVPHQPAGAAIRASAMPVECALDSGQAATLATVPVAGAASTSGPGRHITVTPRASGSQRGT